MGCVMGELSAVNLILFVSATFAASFVAGLAGFAFAIIAAAVWLHFLPPAQCTVLIAAFGLIVQGWAVWKLREAIRPFRLAPFLIGAVIGVPLGAELLRWASPDSLRFGIGIVLVAFSLYSLIRPKLPAPSAAGRVTDGLVGTLNGALGGATGFAGIILTVWCTLRGWPPPEQRAVFQPVGVFVFLLTAMFLGVTGTIGWVPVSPAARLREARLSVRRRSQPDLFRVYPPTTRERWCLRAPLPSPRQSRS
jgi:uncharacterized protein